jgi:hypothetical protein
MGSGGCKGRYRQSPAFQAGAIGRNARPRRLAFGRRIEARRDRKGSRHLEVDRRGDITPRPAKIPIEALLVVGRKSTSRTHLKTRLIGEGLKENRCEICGIAEWRGKPLSMQLHHVNGDGSDNRLENLQLLFGNCHSQTDNWGGRGVRRKGGSGRRRRPAC